MSPVLLIAVISIGQPNFVFQKSSYDPEWHIAIDEIPVGETLGREKIGELDSGAYLVNFQVRIEGGGGQECFTRIRCSQGVPGSGTTKLHLYTKDFRAQADKEIWNFFFLVPKFEVVAKDSVTYQVEVGYKLPAPLEARNTSGRILLDPQNNSPLLDLSRDRVIRSIAWQFGPDKAVNTEQDHPEVARLDLPSILWNGVRGSFLVYSSPAPGLAIPRLVYEAIAPSKAQPQAVAPSKAYPGSDGIPTYVYGPGERIKVGITEKLQFPIEGEYDALRLLPVDPVFGERVESGRGEVAGGVEVPAAGRRPVPPAASLPVAASDGSRTAVSRPPVDRSAVPAASSSAAVRASTAVPTAVDYSTSTPRYVAPIYGNRYLPSAPPRRSLQRLFGRGR